MKTINLTFEKSETGLAGFPYGKSVYDNQVKENIDFETTTTIVFPEQIKKVASSFVQGFFAEIIENIGYKELKNHIIINSTNEGLVESIWKRVM